MKEENALSFLLAERSQVAAAVPAKLVDDIYGIEERLQFDADRREAAPRIRKVVEAMLDAEDLQG